ncbi:probable lysophospholipase BODYGUARD 4 isoform X2 [Physcomitrium patens]|uniref:AB hydrolase-1 domain-containing protein n=1 Tax=Physcomitrium patens TaxID=3218 RepID=A0A7I4FBP3_PHYPA|nr:probable lysophospholipase BODYGUARD 4 isoform X2 [Physcomitrium patens]|eukprot:XP_024396688.1 probable lysophospholipase BODYGUARD 4 isoform X2 [Physcomitrella patens]
MGLEVQNTLRSFGALRDDSCYCHKDFPTPELDNKKLAALPPSRAGSATDCEFWEGHSNTLYGRRHKHGNNHVHFLTLHRSLSAEAVEPLNLLDKRVAGLICGKGSREKSSDSELLPKKESVLNVATNDSVAPEICILKESNRQAGSQHGSLGSSSPRTRWSDCGCATCTAWQANKDFLYVRVGGKDCTIDAASNGEGEEDSTNDVIFIHGFLSSSSFWTETVFPLFSENLKSTHRLFAVDVLGFGKSPKPTNCHYSNADHLEMIRKSVIDRYKLKKYHLVAHSMGCTLALSLAGQDPSAVRSITLVSPPYYPATSDSQPSVHLLKSVAPRKIWPLFALGPSVMSWYEHLGRVVCLVVCKNHAFWELASAFAFNKILRWRVPQFLIHDFMQHTHNSAWHIFHNTLCSGAYTTKWSMDVLQKTRKPIRIIHGDNDNICPLQCSLDMKNSYSNVYLSVIQGANHVNILLGREETLAQELEEEILKV